MRYWKEQQHFFAGSIGMGVFLGNHIVPYTILALFTGGRDYARASAECFVEVVFESVKSTTDLGDGWTCMAELAWKLRRLLQ